MRRKNLFTAFLLLVMAALLFVAVNKGDKGILGFILCDGISPCTSAPEPPVTVSGYMRIGLVQLKYYPEKRIPLAGNWDTISTVVMQNCTTSATFSFPGIVSSSIGNGIITVPLTTNIPDGNYRFFIRGASHLNKEFNCYAVKPGSALFDLTPEGVLLAGEVSNVYDNYINSLDISVLSKKLFTGDYFSDLNQDSKVNGLDLGNQIYNIFIAGD